MPSVVKAPVEALEPLGSKHVLLRLRAPDVAAAAEPGQFVHVRCAPAGQWDPLLRRPFSLHRYDRGNGRIEILFRIVGRGTEFLAGLRPGDEVDLIGPLGHGFPVRVEPGRTPVIVAGGIGVAPLVALAERLREAGTPAVALVGARSGDELLALDTLATAAARILTATDDGTVGRRALVTEILAEVLEGLAGAVVSACGPEPMLRRVQEMITAMPTVRGHLSLEARMACGVGACLGCAVRAAGPTPAYRHVCRDGPVFEAGEVSL